MCREQRWLSRRVITSMAGSSSLLMPDRGGQLGHRAGKASLEDKETEVGVWNSNWRK